MLTKTCPGSIISALRDIENNITPSGYTLCSNSAQKMAIQRGLQYYTALIAKNCTPLYALLTVLFLPQKMCDKGLDIVWDFGIYTVST